MLTVCRRIRGSDGDFQFLLFLSQNAEYKNGYSKDDQTIKLFWQVFHDLSKDEKKRFLKFLTGTDRVPILGMKAVKVSLVWCPYPFLLRDRL
jgi:hypothetical protein